MKINQEQFKQGWVQLEKHLKMHWDKFTQEDYALIDGNLERFNRVNEQRYGATHGDVRKAADRWYAFIKSKMTAGSGFEAEMGAVDIASHPIAVQFACVKFSLNQRTVRSSRSRWCCGWRTAWPSSG